MAFSHSMDCEGYVNLFVIAVCGCIMNCRAVVNDSNR